MLPKQVQEMVEQAQEAEKGLFGDHPPQEDEGTQPDEGVEGQEPETPEVPEDAPPTEEIPVGEEGEEPSGEEPPSGDVDWEHKYRVLQGKYNAEVPRLHKELKQLKREKEELLARLSLLEQMVVQLQAQQTAAPSAEPATAQPEEEEEELKLLKENYPEVYNAITKLLEKTIHKQVEPKLHEVSEQTFYTQLTTIVPDWQSINTDPEFIEWLNQADPISGFTRMQLLRQAYEQKDVNRVARFFIAYKEEKQKAQQSASTPPPAAKNVAPPQRKTAPSSPTGRGSKKVFKQSEVEEFYKLAAMGKIPLDERKRMEEEILRAVMENRILYGK